MSDDIKPKKAWGRTLKEFQTVEEDFAIDGLYPAEYGLMLACERGEAYICEGFDPNWPERPWTIRKELNFIRFDFLRFLILGGDEEAPVDGYGLRLRGAYVSHSHSSDSRNLRLEGQLIDTDIFVEYCTLTGNLNLYDSEICTLVLDGSHILAIFGDGIFSKGQVSIGKGFQAGGEIRFLGAKILGDLNCEGGIFLNKDVSLNCDSIEVARCVSLQKGFKAFGEVRALGAQIGGDLFCEQSEFLSERDGLSCDGASINGALFFKKVKRFSGALSLPSVNLGALLIDKDSWTLPSFIDMDGCRFCRFGGDISEWDKESWLYLFLGKQNINVSVPKKFRPSAHNQLAKVLKEMGHEEDAIEVHINRAEHSLRADISRLKEVHFEIFWIANLDLSKRASIFWRIILKWTTGFGYRPLRTLWFLIPLFLLGWLFFFRSAELEVMAPTDPLIYLETSIISKEPNQVSSCKKNWTSPKCSSILPSEHSTFSPAIYSLDVMLPIINFRQQDDWAPRLEQPCAAWTCGAWWIRGWEWLQTALGWLLSLLLVSGVTGIIRKD